MDERTAVLLAIVALLGMNQAAMRIPRHRRDARVYWTIQAVDLVAATVIILFGLPGFEPFPAVPVVVGLLFVLHVAQNYNQRAREAGRERSAELDAVKAEAERLRATRSPDEDF